MNTVNPGLVADAPFYSPEHGEFLSSQAARLQSVLKDYNPYLELVFVPTNKRDATDTHPYAIRDNSPAISPTAEPVVSSKRLMPRPSSR